MYKLDKKSLSNKIFNVVNFGEKIIMEEPYNKEELEISFAKLRSDIEECVFNLSVSEVEKYSLEDFILRVIRRQYTFDDLRIDLYQRYMPDYDATLLVAFMSYFGLDVNDTNVLFPCDYNCKILRYFICFLVAIGMDHKCPNLDEAVYEIKNKIIRTRDCLSRITLNAKLG